jgi:acyl carrier protein
VESDRRKALAVINKFLLRLEKSREDLTDETPLYGDGLGLDSVEAAELSATLEDELGSDPFSVGDGVPEKVGDILAFYGTEAKA